MRKFILHVLLIFCLLIIVNIILYLLLKDSSYSRYYQYLNSLNNFKKKEYNYLATGDSHANSVWRDNTYGDMLDFTFPGDNEADINSKLHFLERNGYKYNYHIYEIDPHIISTYRESSNNNDLSKILDDTEFNINIKRYLPLFFNGRTIQDLTAHIRGSQDDLEIGVVDSSWVTNTKAIIERANSQFIGKKVSNKLMDFQEQNFDISIKLGAKIILVSYPMHIKYLQLIDSTDVFIQGRLNAKDKSRANNFIYLNYQNGFCDNKNYYNQDHLNSIGAELLRKDIIGSIEKSNYAEKSCIDIIKYGNSY